MLSPFLFDRPMPDKYGGRLVADVVLVDERGRETKVADLLMKAGLAYEYHGGTKKSWCDIKSPNPGGKRQPP